MTMRVTPSAARDWITLPEGASVTTSSIANRVTERGLRMTLICNDFSRISGTGRCDGWKTLEAVDTVGSSAD